MTAVTREQAIAEAGEVIAADLAQQQTRPAREAALASLGRNATDEQIAAWITTHRPAAARSA